MKHKLLTLASAALLFAACSDTSVSDANDEIKEKGTVTIFAYDVLTRLPLKDVSVYYRTTKKTKKTDSTGTIVWKGVDIGHSYFDLQKEGYAMKRHTMFVDDHIQHDVARVYDYTEKVEMYELCVDVKGQFFYVDPETKNWVPAANATIYVDYPDSSEIYPNEVYTKTDSNGFYSFKNLAANVGFEVRSERFTVDSVVYEVDSIGATAQRKGVLKEMDPLAAVVASLDPKMVSSNLSNVGVKDEIKLNFTEVLEKDSVNTKYIKVLRVNNPPVPDANGKPTNVTDVAISVSLSGDGKTITIKSNSGEWADGKDYLVEFDVWSKLAKNLKDSVKINGVTYEKYRKFTAGTLAVPGQVKNLAIDKFDDDAKTDKIFFKFTGTYTADKVAAGEDDLKYNEEIHIKWSGIEKGVDGYNVYVKGDIDEFADYRLVKYVTDTTTSLNLAGIFNDGTYLDFPAEKKQPKKVSVIVLPKNSAGEALAKDATVLEIKTYDRADDAVYAIQTNGYNTFAKTELTKVYNCGANGTSCTSVSGTGLVVGNYYSADLIVSVTETEDDWVAKLPDGRSNVPNRFQLYYKGDLVLDQASSSFTITHGAKINDVELPFTKAVPEYSKTTGKRYEFVIVPYISEGKCSYEIYGTEASCQSNGYTWTGYKIGQTDLTEKNSLSASNNLTTDFNDF